MTWAGDYEECWATQPSFLWTIPKSRKQKTAGTQCVNKRTVLKFILGLLDSGSTLFKQHREELLWLDSFNQGCLMFVPVRCPLETTNTQCWLNYAITFKDIWQFHPVTRTNWLDRSGHQYWSGEWSQPVDLGGCPSVKGGGGLWRLVIWESGKLLHFLCHVV